MQRPVAPSAISLLAAAALAVVASNESAAQSRACRQLLSMAKSATEPESSRWQLERQLDHAIRKAERRGFFIFGSGKGCAALVSRIDRLEHRLHDRPARGFNAHALNRELARLGCHERTAPDKERTAERIEPEVLSPNPFPSGSFRTVCVRACDGYFFPLGYAQQRSDFEKDEAACKGLYGSAPAELYYYPTEGKSEEMFSVRGDAYRSQGFAFLYQKTFKPECHAQLQAGFERVRQTFLAAASAASRMSRAAMIPLPAPRPTPEGETDAGGDGRPPATRSTARVIEAFPTYVTSGEGSSEPPPRLGYAPE